jgi:glycosyltransferase involved in cell wall biosynthesis
MNGIETYAEQVAVAARAAGNEVTLAVTGEVAEASVRKRLTQADLRIVSLGLGRLTPRRILLERLAPQLQTARVGRALARAVAADGLRGFDVVHLNRAPLASWARGAAARTFVTGWFFPHALVPRLKETWRDTRGASARRAALTAKAFAYYVGDVSGYRCASHIVACTETLARQLASRGLPASACPPPVRVVTADSAPVPRASKTELELLICSGDLSHPRKNLRDAVQALPFIARDRRIVLRAIGRNGAHLEAAARGLPPNVRLELLGPQAPEAVHTAMRSADAFLFPSLYEEWGYVATEAILSGTPVVAYPVYPFHEMLKGGLGHVASSMEPRALAEAAELALRGPRGAALAQSGAERFGSEAVGRRLTAIWRGEA